MRYKYMSDIRFNENKPSTQKTGVQIKLCYINHNSENRMEEPTNFFNTSNTPTLPARKAHQRP